MNIGFKQLFGVKGRSGRLEYFIHTISDMVLLIVYLVLVFGLEAMLGVRTSEVGFAIAIFSIIILGLVTQTCVTIRRFHDMGMSGWTLLATMIPIVNIYFGLILLFKKGTVGTNKYGGE